LICRCFAHEVDARRFWDAMLQAVRGVCVSLHPEKTRLIEFGRQRGPARRRGLGKRETFRFSGFTHISDAPVYRARAGAPVALGDRTRSGESSPDVATTANSSNRLRIASRRRLAIDPVREANDDIIGIPHDHHSARGLAPSPALAQRQTRSAGRRWRAAAKSPNLSRPLITDRDDPSSSTPTFNHFWIRRMMRDRPPDVRQNDQPCWLTSSKKGSDVRVKNEVTSCR